MPQIKPTTIELSGIHSFSVSADLEGNTRINMNGTGVRIVIQKKFEGADYDSLREDPEGFIKQIYGFEDPPEPKKEESQVTVKEG